MHPPGWGFNQSESLSGIETINFQFDAPVTKFQPIWIPIRDWNNTDIPYCNPAGFNQSESLSGIETCKTEVDARHWVEVSTNLNPYQGLKLGMAEVQSKSLSFNQSESLSGIETGLSKKIATQNYGFNQSESLSGIETKQGEPYAGC